MNAILKTLYVFFIFLICVNSSIAQNTRNRKKNFELSQASKQQTTSKDSTAITLIASGEGETKEEAAKNALRSALEQAYGAFVSANTTVINDELVRDEIVTLSQGNILSYKEIGTLDLKNGNKETTVSAVVSINKLRKYAVNKGMQAEFAGSTFAMNAKLRKLNADNERKAIEHLIEKCVLMCDQVFDYEIEVNEDLSRIVVYIKGNRNLQTLRTYLWQGLTEISNSATCNGNVELINGRMKNRTENIEVYPIYLLKTKNEWSKLRFRKYYDISIFEDLERKLWEQIYSFKVSDNLGNNTDIYLSKEHKDGRRFVTIPAGWLNNKNRKIAFSKLCHFFPGTEIPTDEYADISSADILDLFLSNKLNGHIYVAVHYTEDEVSRLTNFKVDYNEISFWDRDKEKKIASYVKQLIEKNNLTVDQACTKVANSFGIYRDDARKCYYKYEKKRPTHEEDWKPNGRILNRNDFVK